MKRKFFGKYELLLEIYKMQIMEKKYVLTFNKIKNYILHNKDIPSNILYSNLYNYIQKGIININSEKDEEIKNITDLKNLSFTLSQKGIEIVRSKLEKEEKKFIKRLKKKKNKQTKIK